MYLDCVAWTLEVDSGKCSLKTASTPVQKSEGWVSGQRCNQKLPTFPDMFTLSSSGPAATEQNSTMGTYYKMDGVIRFNRPVWKKEGGDMFIYFSPGGFWSVGPDSTSISPLLSTVDRYLADPSRTKWMYLSSNSHKIDPQLEAKGESMKGERKV